MPILSSFLPMVKPGVPLSTMKALMPRCLALLSVVAKTMAVSASYELVIQHFSPFNTHESPSSVACVCVCVCVHYACDRISKQNKIHSVLTDLIWQLHIRVRVMARKPSYSS